MTTFAQIDAAAIAEWVRVPVAIFYATLLTVIAIYGLHRLSVLATWWRVKRCVPTPDRPFAEGELPTVTVQLPMYNEPHVAERVIVAACEIDYPADRLQIQVLDDSTDATTEIARRTCRRLREAGRNVTCLHRDDRSGFKAGALANGLDTASGELIAIFDADFIPPRNFLRCLVDHFTDEHVGVVQARWAHLNADASALTRVEAALLDGHFIVEQTARNFAGRMTGFNGTAGVWRRAAIDDAGGWSADTLTEDMDLSYRAQLRGWRAVYRPDVTCPAELPPHLGAVVAQQRRWTTGALQNAQKHLLNILGRSDLPLRTRVEAAFHLTHPLIYPVIVAITLIMLPVVGMHVELTGSTRAATGISLGLFITATLSIVLHYGAAMRTAGHRWTVILRRIPAVMALGVGLSVSNTVGVLAAIAGRARVFERTPKYRAIDGDASWAVRANVDRAPTRVWTAAGATTMCLYTLATIAVSAGSASTIWSIPFMAIIAAGYGWVGVGCAAGSRSTRRATAPCPAAEMP
ncbi:MAG: glycosyltransferase [Phycisphaera sp.]|nr:glycosyltransferase [Phycisphaera sp.]